MRLAYIKDVRFNHHTYQSPWELWNRMISWYGIERSEVCKGKRVK